jgi:osmoprotectant transport system ATP-binding protein
VHAHYHTPAKILSHPGDEFVARFVGADRALKRLALTTVAELDLVAPNGPAGARRVPPTTSARDALSMLLLSGGQPLLVVDGQDQVEGLVTMQLLEELVSTEAGERGSP